MKRWIIWLLILVLALSGCTTDEPDQTTIPPSTTQQPTTPPVSLYISGSSLEKNTEGIVKVYGVDGGINGIIPMEEDMVVLTFDGAKTTITRVSSEEGIVKATATCAGLLAGDAIGTAENKLAYYDSTRNCIVILDDRLQQIDRLELPKEVAGTPVFSQDLSTAFYCSGNEIRGLDLTTGIARLVSQLNTQHVQIMGLLMEDTVIHCYVTDTHGSNQDVFYSAVTGEKLGSDDDLTYIQSWGENYLLRRNDGPVVEILVGNNDTIQRFTPIDSDRILTVLPCNNAVAEILQGESGDGIMVYEMTEGKALGMVNLSGVVGLRLIAEDPDGQHLWFCAKDPVNGEDILCRWDYRAQGSDQVARIGKRYTAQDQDTAGLEQCKQLAQSIGKKYHVEILIHDDVIAPSNYTFVTEYQVSAYQEALQELDAAMSRFPENFFYLIGSSSVSGKIKINLVRQLIPNRYDVPEADTGYQYWIGENSYMALVVCDDIERNFYHELCHAMDTYVYANTAQYDFWIAENPEGFQYDESYDVYETHEGSPYLEGETRAFINAFSMTYPHEDRATVMEYALTDGNAEFFESDIMQHKLTILCKAIRRAFGWRYNENTYPWEQYLKESQAYVKDKK